MAEAKKTKEATSVDKAEQMKKAREARDRAAGKDKFVFLKDNPDAKLAPQAKAIVDIIKAAGKSGITRDEVVKGMAGKVTTRQPLGRILAYYVKKITNETGLCRLDKVAPSAA